MAQVEGRDTYGAIVLSTSGAPEVLTASAGSSVATQLLNGVATQLQTQLTEQVTAAGGDASMAPQVVVTELVPLAASDAAGSGLAASAFPLTMGGMLGGVLTSLSVKGLWRRLATVTLFSASAALIITFVLQTWFEYLQGNFGVNSLAIGLSILASSTFIVGAATLLGTAGIGAAALVTFLIGNPLSAAAMPWQFLVEPWGAIGQFLVPGASNWLLRSLSYFPSADTAQQWWTLAGWVAFGLVLALIGTAVRDRRSIAPAEVEPAEAATAEATTRAPVSA